MVAHSPRALCTWSSGVEREVAQRCTHMESNKKTIFEHLCKQVVHMYELPFTQRHSCATERLQRTLHSRGVSVGGTGWIIVLIWNWHGRLLVQTQHEHEVF